MRSTSRARWRDRRSGIRSSGAGLTRRRAPWGRRFRSSSSPFPSSSSGWLFPDLGSVAMPKHSAGLLLYRVGDDGTEVLLVHPGGPFWARNDDGAWSIPKGEVEPDEEPLEVALREFGE